MAQQSLFHGISDRNTFVVICIQRRRRRQIPWLRSEAVEIHLLPAAPSSCSCRGSGCSKLSPTPSKPHPNLIQTQPLHCLIPLDGGSLLLQVHADTSCNSLLFTDPPKPDLILHPGRSTAAPGSSHPPHPLLLPSVPPWLCPPCLDAPSISTMTNTHHVFVPAD